MTTKNHAAIVTGAGSGIGRATALQLAREGWRVALVGRTAEKLRETAALIGEKAGPLVLPADVTDPAACWTVVSQAAAELGRLDLLCNNAGYAATATIAQSDDRLWRTTLDTNLSAVFYLTRAAWPVFERQRSGVVVNVSSMASFDPFPGFAAYAAAKAGVNMLTRFTASEGKPIGVRAVGVAPGAVETPMLRGIFDDRQIPSSAAMPPERIAGLIGDCASGRRAFESGETITIEP